MQARRGIREPPSLVVASPATAARGLKVAAPERVADFSSPSVDSASLMSASNASSSVLSASSRVRRRVLICRMPHQTADGEGDSHDGMAAATGGLPAGLSSTLLSTFGPATFGHFSEFSLGPAAESPATASPKRNGPRRFCTVLNPDQAEASASTSSLRDDSPMPTTTHDQHERSGNVSRAASSPLVPSLAAPRSRSRQFRQMTEDFSGADMEEDQPEASPSREEELAMRSPRRRGTRASRRRMPQPTAVEEVSSEGEDLPDADQHEAQPSRPMAPPPSGRRKRGRPRKVIEVEEEPEPEDEEDEEEINTGCDDVEEEQEEEEQAPFKQSAATFKSPEGLTFSSEESDSQEVVQSAFKVPMGRPRKAAAQANKARARLPDKSMIPPPPMATPSTSKEADEEDEVSKLMSSARYLKNWVPSLHHGKKFIVEGELLDFSLGSAPGSVFPERWKTSKIRRRRRGYLVETSGSAYVLEGKLNRRLAEETNMPQFIIHAFQDGFPENWEVYRDQWKLFLHEQIVNCSSISSISSVGNASAFVRTRQPPLVPSKTNTLPCATTDEISHERDKAMPSHEEQVSRPSSERTRPRPSPERPEARPSPERPKARPPPERLKAKPSPVRTRAGPSPERTSARPSPERPKARPSPEKPRARLSPERPEARPSPERPRAKPSPKKQDISIRPKASISDQNELSISKRTRRKANQTLDDKKEGDLAEVDHRQSPVVQRRKRGRQPKSPPQQEQAVEEEMDVEVSLAQRRTRRTNYARAKKVAVDEASPTPSPAKPRRGQHSRRKKSESDEDWQEEEVTGKSIKTANAGKGKEKQQSAGKAKSERKKKPAEKPEPKHPALQPRLDLMDLVSKPRTVRERVKNAQILRNYHHGHADDIFESSGVGAKKQQRGSGNQKGRGRKKPPPLPMISGSGGASGIVGELFGSDSENDISLHSARTPVVNYMRKGRRQSSEVATAAASPQEEEEEQQLRQG